MAVERWVIVGCCLGTLGAGLAAGIFFAFSSFVMSALGSVPPRAGIAVMNAINVSVINAGFMLVFLGTGALSIALALASFRWWNHVRTVSCLGAAALFLAVLVRRAAG